MIQFLLRRLTISLFVALTVSIISFSLLRLSGDLAVALAGDNSTPAEIARVAAAYGLDQPLYMQYLDWAGNALRGDLGRSLFTHEPVSDLILSRIGVTIGLAVPSLFVALLLAVPLGVLAAVNANSWIDRVALSLAVFGQAIPIFWFALVLIYIFAVVLRWLPVSGTDSVAHFILPITALSLTIMPSFMRITRAGMLEILSADFVRTARANGLHPLSVLFKHALRNAILPVVSLSAVQLGFLLGGSVIIETIFALNGVGYLAFQSITSFDFPVVQSILVFLSFAYIFLTLMSDLINAKLDPRIRL
jgi:peptide/nickel transport system permease protein